MFWILSFIAILNFDQDIVDCLLLFILMVENSLIIFSTCINPLLNCIVLSMLAIKCVSDSLFFLSLVWLLYGLCFQICSNRNMLELLHKVDQLSEQGNEMHFNSKMPEAETSDASFHVQRDQSPASQAFGLQLAPPSQRGLIPEHALPSQSPTNAIISTRLAPASSVQF
jgi:hypothetical protein